MHANTSGAFAHQLSKHFKQSLFLTSRAVCMNFFLAFALVGCGGGGGNGAAPVASIPVAPATPATPAKPVVVPSVLMGNWIVMGSSTAAGTGASAGKGWVELLRTQWSSKGYSLVNIAKPGATTYLALTNASSVVPNRPLPDTAMNIDQALTRNPTLLIISFPTNDTNAGYSVDEIVANLLAIRAKALAASVPVIVLSTQPRNFDASRLSQLRDIDERMASEAGGCFVAIRTKLAGGDGRLASIYDSGDAVHPNDLGHALIAGAVNVVLRSGACVNVAP